MQDKEDSLKSSLQMVDFLYETIDIKDCDTPCDQNTFHRTPQQRTKNSKFLPGKNPLQLSGLETYHRLPQPEPPKSPMSGLDSDDSVSHFSDSEEYFHFLYATTKASFRCNLCGESFPENYQLLTHLKLQHLAMVRALKAQYSCGKCPAKFFKNAFLIKHIKTHCER